VLLHPFCTPVQLKALKCIQKPLVGSTVMRIEHIALWTDRLEQMRQFYTHYFRGSSGEKYVNPAKHFQSYFISFEEGSRIELMQQEGVYNRQKQHVGRSVGIAHFAIAVGTKMDVDTITKRLAADGYKIVSQPGTTGDGYYESVVLDPDGNELEIVADC
jgi:lactoylglutathione lyase